MKVKNLFLTAKNGLVGSSILRILKKTKNLILLQLAEVNWIYVLYKIRKIF